MFKLVIFRENDDQKKEFLAASEHVALRINQPGHPGNSRCYGNLLSVAEIDQEELDACRPPDAGLVALKKPIQYDIARREATILIAHQDCPLESLYTYPGAEEILNLKDPTGRDPGRFEIGQGVCYIPREARRVGDLTTRFDLLKLTGFSNNDTERLFCLLDGRSPREVGASIPFAQIDTGQLRATVQRFGEPNAKTVWTSPWNSTLDKDRLELFLADNNIILCYH